MTNRMKKVAIICSITVGVILLGAVIFGILNALVGDGTWSTGWNDYRYDENGFEIGDATVSSQSLTEIEIDWIDGAVLIVPCQDAYPSLTETTEDGAELPDSSRLRWKISENGERLTVKYRKSSWFFGFGSQNRNKTLILRLPEAMMSQLRELDVTSVSGNIVIDQLQAQRIELETVSGNLKIQNTVCESFALETVNGDALIDCNARQHMEIESVNADLTLVMPADAAFSLHWESVSGHISSDFAYQQSGNTYTVGSGGRAIEIESVDGNLMLSKKQ